MSKRNKKGNPDDRTLKVLIWITTILRLINALMDFISKLDE